MKASPNPPRRAEGTGACVGWLNFGLEAAHEGFALLRCYRNYHRSYEADSEPCLIDISESLHVSSSSWVCAQSEVDAPDSVPCVKTIRFS
jgi:hypothetical protein